MPALVRHIDIGQAIRNGRSFDLGGRLDGASRGFAL
jgi:hypothetical protein